MTPLDAAKVLAAKRDWVGLGGDGTCIVCGYPSETNHDPDCPLLMLTQIVAALEAGSDCAGLLQMVLDNQIRNKWVAEDSPELDVPRGVLERWYALNPLPPAEP